MLFSTFDRRRPADAFRGLVASAGIIVGCSRPWALQVHDERLWTRILRDGTLGAGEAYEDGWWDVPALDQFFDRILRVDVTAALRNHWVVAHGIRARLFNMQSITRAFESGQHHYDIGND